MLSVPLATTPQWGSGSPPFLHPAYASLCEKWIRKMHHME